MTLEEIRAKKQQLTTDVAELIKKFAEETDLKVMDIDISYFTWGYHGTRELRNIKIVLEDV
jgi:hypothetical protein